MRFLRTALPALLACSAPDAVLAEEDPLHYYEICLNGRCAQPVAVLSVGPGHWLPRADAMAEAGLDVAQWPGQTHEGVRYIDLQARFPSAQARLDEATQTLHITLPGEAWPLRNYSAGRARTRPAVPVAETPSAFLNYNLYASSDKDYGLYGELGWVRGGWLVRSSFNLNDSGVQRGMSALEYDQPERQRRWVLGDQFLVGYDAFASSARIAGLGVQRAYDLTPGFVRFPGADIRGVMQAPGQVDVYSNGSLVARQELGAGPFSLQDLALAQGSNDLRIVVNDPFIGSYELSGDYYASPRLLRRGLHEFDDRVGWIRAPGVSEGYRSGPPLISIKHRYGLSDVLTAAARYEQLGARRNLGVSVDFKPGVGSLSLAVAASQGDGQPGGRTWRSDYSWQGRRMSLGFGLRRQSSDYRPILANPFQAGTSASQREQYAQISLALAHRLALSGRYAEQQHLSGERRRSVGFGLAWRIARLRAHLGMTRRTGSVAAGDEIFFTLQLPLGEDSYGLGLENRQGSTRTRLSAQRSAPTDQGWGYSLDLEHGQGSDRIELELEQVSVIGRGNLRLGRAGDQTTADLRYAGSLLWTQGHMYLSQPGNAGFALVQVPGMPGVPVLRENLPVGVTNQHGNLLVPGLLAYQSNLIGLDLSAMDATVQLAEESRLVSVPRYGVALVSFPVRSVSAVQAFLQVQREGRWQRLDAGEARVAGTGQSTTVGREGQVYFEGLAPGLQKIEVDSGATRWLCEITVPSAQAMAWLGEISCMPR